MQFTAYCYYVRFRSRAVERRVFSTAEDRRIALRTLAREQVDDVSEEATAVQLVDLLLNLGVSVDVFEGSVTASENPTSAPSRMTAAWSSLPRAIGDEANPRGRLLGTLDINGVSFHAEFIQVRRDRKTGEQRPVQSTQTNWDALCQSDDGGAFQTITLNRRRYALLVTPYTD